MDNKELFNKLDTLQAEQNNGRGIQCVKNACFDFRAGDIQGGLQTLFIDSDKLSQYPEIEDFIHENLIRIKIDWEMLDIEKKERWKIGDKLISNDIK
jgi:hypothetical protein